MNYYIAALYGVIQGLAEFLPISSSGHLALLPVTLDFTDPGVAFDLAMHFGTALAIMIYFFKDLSTVYKSGLGIIKRGYKIEKSDGLILNIVVSTIVSVLVVLIIKDLAATFGRGPKIIAFNLVFFGAILYLSEKFSSKFSDGHFDLFSLKHSLLIGFAQAFAAFPGVSRSGVTLSAAKILGVSKTEASRYSFLLSLPIVLAGIIYKLPSFFKSEAVAEPGHIVLGIVVSFIVGLLTIHFFMKFVSKINFAVFFIYRVLLAFLLLMFIL